MLNRNRFSARLILRALIGSALLIVLVITYRSLKNETGTLDEKQSIDRDTIRIQGEDYLVASKGEKSWSISTLKVTRFQNGDPLYKSKNKTDWIHCFQSGRPTYMTMVIKGQVVYFYNYYALEDPRLLLPDDFKVITPNGVRSHPLLSEILTDGSIGHIDKTGSYQKSEVKMIWLREKENTKYAELISGNGHVVHDAVEGTGFPIYFESKHIKRVMSPITVSDVEIISPGKFSIDGSLKDVETWEEVETIILNQSKQYKYKQKSSDDFSFWYEIPENVRLKYLTPPDTVQYLFNEKLDYPFKVHFRESTYKGVYVNYYFLNTYEVDEFLNIDYDSFYSVSHWLEGMTLEPNRRKFRSSGSHVEEAKVLKWLGLELNDPFSDFTHSVTDGQGNYFFSFATRLPNSEDMETIFVSKIGQYYKVLNQKQIYNEGIYSFKQLPIYFNKEPIFKILTGVPESHTYEAGYIYFNSKSWVWEDEIKLAK